MLSPFWQRAWCHRLIGFRFDISSLRVCPSFQRVSQLALQFTCMCQPYNLGLSNLWNTRESNPRKRLQDSTLASQRSSQDVPFQTCQLICQTNPDSWQVTQASPQSLPGNDWQILSQWVRLVNFAVFSPLVWSHQFLTSGLSLLQAFASWLWSTLWMSLWVFLGKRKL